MIKSLSFASGGRRSSRLGRGGTGPDRPCCRGSAAAASPPSRCEGSRTWYALSPCSPYALCTHSIACGPARASFGLREVLGSMLPFVEARKGSNGELLNVVLIRLNVSGTICDSREARLASTRELGLDDPRLEPSLTGPTVLGVVSTGSGLTARSGREKLYFCPSGSSATSRLTGSGPTGQDAMGSVRARNADIAVSVERGRLVNLLECRSRVS